MDKPILEIENLSIGYGKPICSHINAKVYSGELVGLAGKNGSGKSTLIKTILGLQPSLGGKILSESQNLENWSIQEKSKRIAVVFSRLEQVPPISVLDLIGLGRLPYQSNFSKLLKSDKDLIHNAIHIVGIEELSSKFANQLSDGQLQMVMIARALVQETDIILMDEPTSHLDIENQFKIFELIHNLVNQTGKTFIVASHQIELLLQNATQFWWMNKGQFSAGFPEQIAYDNDIYDELSQEKIRFDYKLGKFQFLKENVKTIQFHSDHSKLAFWTKTALERNGFQFSENAQNKIKVKNNQLYLNDKKWNSIESLVNHLMNY